MEDVNGMPTPIVVSRETYVTRQEIQTKYPGAMARLEKVIENDEGLIRDSESITYRDDIGYIFRYDMMHASTSSVEANPRSFLVVWTKDFERFSAATYSGYDFPNRQ